MKVKHLGKIKTVDLKPNSNVVDLFKKLKENSETYIVKRNDKVIIEKEKLKPSDQVELIKIISGG